MAYLRSVSINGDTSDVKEYKAGTGIRIASDGTISSEASAPSWNSITGKPSFSPVATSGSYNDLSNKPSIPEAYDDTALKSRVSAVETGKQDRLTAGANITISGNTISAAASPVTVDSALSSTSANPVQNRAIKSEIDSLNTGASSAASAINALDARVQALEDGECYDYELDGAYANGSLTLSLSDGTNTQTKTIPVSAVPSGGAADQVLAKKTAADGDVEWKTFTPESDVYMKEVSFSSGTYAMTPLTNDTAPVYIDFSITDTEAATWKVMGIGKYELKDSGNSRVYCTMVSAFSMNTQKTLRTYWKVCGTSNKTVTNGNLVLICVRR